MILWGVITRKQPHVHIYHLVVGQTFIKPKLNRLHLESWAKLGDISQNLRAVLGKKLAASVNILSEASSLYFWNGEIEEATEILLLIKTKTSKVHILSSYVRLVHPFEIPEIFSLPMDQGDVHYLKWLKEGMEED
ncbi:protein CutA homolog isoform X3 [Artibeus jamaicensis]|uniref:protein CutA homolog isoform X3 n=1 Tax=Artibeus jamaicensis TaxID=9417 RepID=UPI00235ACF3A|nr:protein CutA homolog isoform X3 [Artibeus jamaicensis]